MVSGVSPIVERCSGLSESNVDSLPGMELKVVTDGVLGATEKAADIFNPITSGPSAPLKSLSLVDAHGPSLMPRSTLHQGLASGMAVVAAAVVSTPIHWITRQIAPESSPLAWKLTTRGAVAAGGMALSRIQETDHEPTIVSSIRSLGEITTSAALGGMIYEIGTAARKRFPSNGPLRPTLIGLAGFGYALYRSGTSLKERQRVIARWTEEDKPVRLIGSVAIAFAFGSASSGLAAAYKRSQSATADFFGPDVPHQVIGTAVNTAIWAGGTVALYSAGVARIARANEKIEPGYDKAPTSEFVSGGPSSISPFEKLGLQGRRFVTDIVEPELIEKTMGEPAIAHPVRAYVGMNSEPVYPSGRSEIMMDEMEELGAFDRSHLLLFSPTGTGWVDLAVASAAELLTRGDIATVCVQYGRSPSFLAVQQVALGRSQFRLLLWGVKQRLAGRPPEKRPKVLVFGESLGAWSSSDVVMREGIAGFDHYGIDRALWFGLPGLAKWSRTGMREGHGENIAEGAVGAFDNYSELMALTPEERDKMRAVVLDHDNDPIAALSARLAVKRPPWLQSETRGRGVPEDMTWMPLLTLTQTMVDAMNAMRTVPGEFKSFGHDYRADTAEFVYTALHLPESSPEQIRAVDDTLHDLELARFDRLKKGKEAQGDSSSVASDVQ